MLDDDRIEEIKRLRAGITSLPWVDLPHPEWLGAEHLIGLRSASWSQAVFSHVARVSRSSDAAFIAAAPTIVDELLAEREEKERRIVELEAAQKSLGRSALRLVGVIERLVNWRDCHDAMLLRNARFNLEESIELDSRWEKARATLRSEASS